MNEERHEEVSPKCWVEFTKSSTKDGGQGYRISVAQGCSEIEAELAFRIAFSLKTRADEATDATKRARALEESVA